MCDPLSRFPSTSTLDPHTPFPGAHSAKCHASTAIRCTPRSPGLAAPPPSKVSCSPLMPPPWRLKVLFFRELPGGVAFDNHLPKKPPVSLTKKLRLVGRAKRDGTCRAPPVGSGAPLPLTSPRVVPLVVDSWKQGRLGDLLNNYLMTVP